MITAELHVKCLQVEALTKHYLLRGTSDREELTYKVDDFFEPESLEELEAYSESIAHARFAILN
jgi:hypothetical protein